jgi:hypothetical protein
MKMKKKQQSTAPEQAAAAISAPATAIEEKKEIVRKPAIIAKHDRAHCSAPGLFRTFQPGERKKIQHFNITYRYNDETTLNFFGNEPLGADDMLFLQIFVAHGLTDGKMLSPPPKKKKLKKLESFPAPKPDISENVTGIKTSLNGVLQTAGLVNSGANMKTLKASLKRMSKITITLTKHKNEVEREKEASYHLLDYFYDEEDDSLCVTLDPQITTAIFGQSGFTLLDINEVLALETETARLIYQRLCTYADFGEDIFVSLDTLCSYVRPESEEINPGTMRVRRLRVRKAMAEFQKIGWQVDEYKTGYKICRFNRPEFIRHPKLLKNP